MLQVLDDNNRCETTFIIREQPEDMNITPGHSAIHNAGRTLEDTLVALGKQMALLHESYGTGVFRVLIDKPLRVQLARPVDRFPHFVCNAGETGTVVTMKPNCVRVKLDTPPQGSEDWGGCLMWDSLTEFQSDTIVI